MNKRRQRRLAALLLLLVFVIGCGPGAPPVETSVAQAQATAVSSAAQIQATAVSGAAQVQATVVSGAAQIQATAVSVQATAQPIATRVAGALTQLQPTDVGRLIGTTMGATIEITITPPDGPNDQVTQATLNGTDRSGAFGRLDKQAREAFASAGFQLARQAYPRAQLDLTIVDTNGAQLLHGIYPPGGSPTYQ